MDLIEEKQFGRIKGVQEFFAREILMQTLQTSRHCARSSIGRATDFRIESSFDSK